MRRYWSAILLGCALLEGFSGCSSSLRKPRLSSPGTAGFQRFNAERFDPYPQNDMGPEIVGGRPIDYQMPRNEVERVRQPPPMGQWRATPRY
jgi:hypothetical protein